MMKKNWIKMIQFDQPCVLLNTNQVVTWQQQKQHLSGCRIFVQNRRINDEKKPFQKIYKLCGAPDARRADTVCLPTAGDTGHQRHA
jgi:hypothetical protein